MLTAIIVAGGSSRRMGFDKTFATLAGKPVIAHSIAAFENAECVSGIIVVGRADRVGEIRDLVAQQKFTKVRNVVPGGVHRQDSVAEGLRHAAEAEFVAVHDAARPLVEPAEVERVYDAARAHGAAALAAPVTDTLKRATADRLVSGSVDREGLYAMQTPQVFAREGLVEAYRSVFARNLTVTDEISAIEHLGRSAVLVPNDHPNFKITFPGDLPLAELVFAQRSAAR